MGLFDNISSSELEQMGGLFAAMPTFSGRRNPMQPMAGYWGQAGEREKAEEERKRQIQRQQEADARRKLMEGRADEQFQRGQMQQTATQGAVSAGMGGRGLLDQPQRQGMLGGISPQVPGDAMMPGAAFSGQVPANIPRMQEELMGQAMGGSPYAQQALKTQQSMTPKAAEPFTLSPGQTRFGGAGDVIATAAPDTSKNKGEVFKAEKALRGEFTKATDTFADVNNAFGRIRASAEDPSAAGDMALIFNYMKMLDPASVVRESEFALAAQAGNYGDRIQAAFNRVASGQRLAAKQRADFVGRARKLYAEATDIHSKRKDEFKRLAEANKLNPKHVTFNRQFYKIDPDELKITPTDINSLVNKYRTK